MRNHLSKRERRARERLQQELANLLTPRQPKGDVRLDVDAATFERLKGANIAERAALVRDAMERRQERRQDRRRSTEESALGPDFEGDGLGRFL